MSETLSSLADYHLHTPLCRHAEGIPAEFARAAAAAGLREIGFSDHSPMASEFDDWRMRIEELPRYFELVADARAAVSEVTIRLGLEVDFFENGEGWIEDLAGRAAWDFLIGSVHYISPGWDIDNPKWIGRFRESDVADIWDQYWRLFGMAARSGFFDIMAHADLPKKFGFIPDGDLNRYYGPAVAAVAEAGAAIEINTAGWHKPVGEPYPAPAFLQLAAEAKIPLVISSDAHAPGEVGRDFGRAAALARDAGFSETARFVRRERRMVPIAG